ncbi:MAG: 2-succinyl-5-enolpyruvyl-6-hydroxy-3-cyclohexene-1-carboxylate synthase, partial [Actinobacteria bacterium]|nr:2-succinyl-5-enolpyruvyl-6-hydroxy-3-cyclohexene-1-carboxylate synthase [Actinomycetota bacterium]NIS29861.1 2-succinyl-5-enolpyruvyl-6-hydroxy-3-cyclohexene-1-carboxylate synthase [Actinomycetota bacterium]NIU18384.1 2-succinyl-5-enolpyruvyl-6-hydroxy-3-cyclohexene-1-carboxylate synthase [Actinomycetota bacterium]NIU65159.1 2-succinyl-5-enolpyruvyl-6-hydroxy-3-cyclohexene-1-carboxylate synthase [Actinomycetota bacterium]NIW26967.1 2-succinyl-5-enolpyruvyl-6-hydroxy-3-cyclohexene-1-carboxyla
MKTGGSLQPIDPNVRFATLLVRSLAAGGVVHAVVAPGSRNTPLSMALASDPSITDLSMHDERSGGFLAIGAARATGRPVVITCTSGT